MKILNFGSLNIDNTYTMEHFVQPGETLTSKDLQRFCGGKGLNQSIALAMAGCKVNHFGCIGSDGDELINILQNSKVNTESIIKLDNIQSGHAIIQVDRYGQNSIILFPGANRQMREEWVYNEIKKYSEGDWLLIQNETNCLEYAMRAAHDHGMKIAFNPSPMDQKVLSLPLELTDLFIINEIEGMSITGKQSPAEIIADLKSRFPDSSVVLTLGKNGSIFKNQNNSIFRPAYLGDVRDTTGAGDTYTGYFLANYIKGIPAHECMQIATMASTIQISRAGAATAIPNKSEVFEALRTL